jgi:hypothetical protein
MFGTPRALTADAERRAPLGPATSNLACKFIERRRRESNPLEAALQAAAWPSGSSVGEQGAGGAEQSVYSLLLAPSSLPKCPRQELDLVFDLRRVACESGTLRGQGECLMGDVGCWMLDGGVAVQHVASTQSRN